MPKNSIKRYMVFAIFLIIILAILVGGHFLIYKGVVNLFDVTSTRALLVLKLIAGILSVSFVLASVLANWSDNAVTRVYYYFSATWLGTGWYVSLAIVLSLVILWLGRLAGVQINSIVLSSTLIGIAFLISSYAMWHAQSVKVKEYEIGIKNLPSAWEDKIIIQVSDVHLGHIHRKNFFETIVQKINTYNPKAVFFSGDLFDGMGGDFSYIIEELENINTTSGNFYAIGNHETFMDFNAILPTIEKANIKLLRNEVVEVDGMQVAGAEYPEMGKPREITEVLNKIQADKPSILMWHEPLRIEQVSEKGVSLMLSGHTHKGQIWPFGYITWMAYKKYHHGLHKLKNSWIYTSSGAGTWGPPMRFGTDAEIVAFRLKKV